MSTQAVRNAAALGKRLQQVFVATADRAGLPHLAAGSIELVAADRVAVEAWFCPGTVQNLADNRSISVVAWDPAVDTGFQLLGEVEAIEETAVLNGLGPDIQAEGRLPQTRRRLVVRVDNVLAFCRRPHSDVAQ